jgi:hypothetical protein
MITLKKHVAGAAAIEPHLGQSVVLGRGLVVDDGHRLTEKFAWHGSLLLDCNLIVIISIL